MFDLYKTECFNEGHSAVKSSFYRHVFNNFFNIGFHVPKTDRCDRCEEMKVKEQEKLVISDEEKKNHDAHLQEKIKMRSEKDRDKKDDTESKIMVVFDLENVITLPKADVGSFFYKRKLTLYNLTACTSTRQGYCAIWTELTSGALMKSEIFSKFIFSDEEFESEIHF